MNVIGASDEVNMLDLPVGTYHAILTTANGEHVIGVFNNYVGYGNRKSILSVYQANAHGLRVSATPHKYGGSQKVVTPDGYVFFKMHYTGGLLYLPMEYPTDANLDSLVHVEFSSPALCLGILKMSEHDGEETLAWFDSVEDDDQLDLFNFYDSHAGWIVAWRWFQLGCGSHCNQHASPCQPNQSQNPC